MSCVASISFWHDNVLALIWLMAVTSFVIVCTLVHVYYVESTTTQGKTTRIYGLRFLQSLFHLSQWQFTAHRSPCDVVPCCTCLVSPAPITDLLLQEPPACVKPYPKWQISCYIWFNTTWHTTVMQRNRKAVIRHLSAVIACGSLASVHFRSHSLTSGFIRGLPAVLVSCPYHAARTSAPSCGFCH